MNLIKWLKKEPIMFIIIGLLFRDFAGYAMLFMQGNLWIVMDTIGFLLIAFCLMFSKKYNLEGSFSTVYSLFMVWTVFMILRGSLIGNYPQGESPNFQGALHFMVSSPMSTLGYVIPLIALFPFSLESLNKFKKIILIILPISLLLVILSIDSIKYAQNVAQYQGYTDLEWRGGAINLRTMMYSFYPIFELTIFMMFCYTYIKTRLKLLIPIGVIVYFICYAIGGGRGSSFLTFCYIVTWLYILYKYPYNENSQFLIRKPAKRANRFYVLIGALLLGYGLYYLIINTETFDFLFYRIFGDAGRSSMFVDNNRSLMTRELIDDFNSTPFSWIIGRGVNGCYVSHSEYSSNGYRAWMEWGYLYLILKGGVIYLFLYVYLFLHAAYKGFFRSRNVLCKAMAFVCLYQVVNLSSTNSEPSLLSTYVLPWYCLGALERNKVRKLDDSTIFKYFNL